MERVTKRELEIYIKINNEEIDTKDKQDYMKIVGSKAVKSLLKQYEQQDK